MVTRLMRCPPLCSRPPAYGAPSRAPRSLVAHSSLLSPGGTAPDGSLTCCFPLPSEYRAAISARACPQRLLTHSGRDFSLRSYLGKAIPRLESAPCIRRLNREPHP